MYLEHEVRRDADDQWQCVADANRQITSPVGTEDVASLWKPETISGTSERREVNVIVYKLYNCTTVQT
jgi:hypothetical protein